MLRFKNVSIAFLLILIVLIVLDVFFQYGLWYVFAALVLYLITVALGARNICSGMFVNVVCRGSSKNCISVTFDDGPSELTPYILDILRQYEVKAAFFCVGNMVEKYPDIVRRIVEEGHIIGNHSYSHHFWFDLKSSGKMLDELLQTQNAIEEIVSKKIKFFRPPYGVTNPPLAKAIRKTRYAVIGWSLKSNDTGNKRVEKLFQRLRRKLTPGDIVLLHDNRAKTPELLKRLLDHAEHNKISIERLDILLNMNAYEM